MVPGPPNSLVFLRKPVPGVRRAPKSVFCPEKPGIPAELVTACHPLSLEGVSQMVYILPERLPALIRPAFDLVLRRIRSLKRCVQACGCKIMTPRYACNLAPGCISSEPTFAGLRKKKKENKGSQKKWSPKKKEKGFPLAKLDIA